VRLTLNAQFWTKLEIRLGSNPVENLWMVPGAAATIILTPSQGLIEAASCRHRSFWRHESPKMVASTP
jgi:hypothetical protein